MHIKRDRISWLWQGRDLEKITILYYSYGFSSSRVRVSQWDHKEGWMPKSWCFRIVVLEKTLETPFDCNKIKPLNPKGTQPWIFIRRTDAEAEAPMGHLMWRANSLEKTRPWCWEQLRAGEEGNRGWDGWMASLTQWTLSLSKLWEIVKDRETWCAAVHGVTKSWTWLWLNNDITGLWIVKGLVFYLRHAFILSESPEQLPLLAYQFWLITNKQLA